MKIINCNPTQNAIHINNFNVYMRDALKNYFVY